MQNLLLKISATFISDAFFKLSRCLTSSESDVGIIKKLNACTYIQIHAHVHALYIFLS